MCVCLCVCVCVCVCVSHCSGQSQALKFGPEWLQGISRKWRTSLGVLHGRFGLPMPYPVEMFLVRACMGMLDTFALLSASCWCMAIKSMYGVAARLTWRVHSCKCSKVLLACIHATLTRTALCTQASSCV